MESKTDMTLRISPIVSSDTGNKGSLSKSDQTYLYIRNLILTAQMKPGQRINEDELSSALNASRTPIREALRRLSNDGLITIYPKRYTEVTVCSPEVSKTLGIVRLSQDILAGRLAIYYGSDAEFTQLYELAKQCEQCDATGDLFHRISADHAFHLKITEIGKNELLMKYQQDLYLRLHLLQIQYAASWDDKVQRVRHHQNILEALTHRDEANYINTVKTRYQEIFSLDPRVLEMCAK